MNTHEYEKIKFMIIRGSFMIIRVEKKLFIIIRVYLCSFVLKKNLYAHSCLFCPRSDEFVARPMVACQSKNSAAVSCNGQCENGNKPYATLRHIDPSRCERKFAPTFFHPCRLHCSDGSDE